MVTKKYVIFRQSDGHLWQSPKELFVDSRLYEDLYDSEPVAAMAIEAMGEPGECYTILPTYLRQC